MSSRAGLAPAVANPGPVPHDRAAVSEPPHEPPRLPDIRDEAADTPNWVPLVGLALLTLAVLYFGIRGSIAPASPPETGAEVAADAAATPDTEATPEPPAAPAGAADDGSTIRRLRPGALEPRGAAIGD